MAAADQQRKVEELTSIIREIQDRVRARYPSGPIGEVHVPLPDLLPVLHARDAAEAKVASIGSVNPRPSGPLNGIIQFFKRQIARSLGWFVRDQVDFNRAVIACVEALLEAFNENNRLTKSFAIRMEENFRELKKEAEMLRWESTELKDIRVHWLSWREEWQHKLSTNEMQFLRSIADIQAQMLQRSLTMEDNFRETTRAQHTEFTLAMAKGIREAQDLLYKDLEKVRLEYEGLIHHELRVLRQKAFTSRPESPATVPTLVPGEIPFDYARFADKFRGPEEYVRNNVQVYVPYFRECTEVLDIGCGRGEFLEVMRDAGVKARGIDLDPESVAACKAKGLEAEVADLFAYLDAAPEASLDGIFCSQVVEHLPPERIPLFVKLASTRLRQGGVLAVETPNPECLAIFATHFYLDPTHTRPIPPALMAFYFEEFGIGRIEIKRLSPAVETMPELVALPQEFRDRFFGALDYGIVGRKI